MTEAQARAIIHAVAVLHGDCATTSARQLLSAFGCVSLETEAILRACHDGRSEDAFAVLIGGAARCESSPEVIALRRHIAELEELIDDYKQLAWERGERDE